MYQVIDLKIIDCQLDIQDATKILQLVSPYVIRTIDFSKNKFNSRDASFVCMVKRKVIGRMCLDKPILCTGFTQVASVTCGRKSFDPVIAQEKAHTIKIISMNQFRTLTNNQTKELSSVTFIGVEINEEFVSKFWELFSDGVNKLSFESCHTTNGYSFSDLFDSLYQVIDLKIIDCQLDIQDATKILQLVSPYVIRTIDFSKNKFNSRDASFVCMVKQKVTGRMCLDKPILCTS